MEEGGSAGGGELIFADEGIVVRNKLQSPVLEE